MEEEIVCWSQISKERIIPKKTKIERILMGKNFGDKTVLEPKKERLEHEDKEEEKERCSGSYCQAVVFPREKE